MTEEKGDVVTSCPWKDISEEFQKFKTPVASFWQHDILRSIKAVK
jgi:hypothetical protein